MKIISIKFLNLNSLKGEHEIRFDRPPFTESGLFAITGPTGAGKTTILDAITLALYGKVHRHDSVEASEIMTRHTAESYSEAEFEVKGMVYRSKWSNYRARKKAGGKLQGVRRELSNAITNEIIENAVIRYDSKIVEVCGLDYNQFLRSVILSQGDFTRFLKAGENERSELLEKITDTEIYSQISIFTFDKTKEEKTKLEDLRGKLNDVSLLTEEETTAHHAIHSQTSGLVNTKTAEKKKQENQLHWLHNISRLKMKKQDLQNKFENFTAEYEAKQSLFKTLSLHQQALKHMPLLKETQASSKQVADTETKLFKNNADLPRMELAALQLSCQLEVTEASYKAAELLQGQMSIVIAEAEKTDVLIDNSQAQYKKEEKDYNSAFAELEKLQAGIAKKNNDAEKLKEEIGELNNWLLHHREEVDLEKAIPVFEGYRERLDELYKKAEAGRKEKDKYELEAVAEDKNLLKLHEEASKSKEQIQAAKELLEDYKGQLLHVLEDKTLEEWEAASADLPALINSYEQQLLIAQEIQQIIINLADYGLQEKTSCEQIALEKDILNKLRQEYQLSEEHFSALQKNVELQMLIQKYEADRKKLQPEQECPLCGSRHHPFAETNYTNERNETEQKRDAEKLKLSAVIKKINSKEILITGLEHGLTNAIKQKEDTTTRQSHLFQTFESNNLKLPEPVASGDHGIIEAITATKKTEQHALKDRIQAIRTLEKKIKEGETAIAKLNEEVLKIEGEIKKAETKIESIRASILRIQTDLNDASENVSGFTGKVVQLLLPLKMNFNYANSRKILLELKDRSAQFLQKQKNLLREQTDLRQTESDLIYARENIKEKTIRFEQIKEQLRTCQSELDTLKKERFVLFSEKNTAWERNRLQNNLAEKRDAFDQIRSELTDKKEALAIIKSRQATLENDLQQLTNNHLQLVANLAMHLAADNIESVEALKKRFLPLKEAEQIELELARLEKFKITIQQSLSDTETELNSETTKAITVETTETLAKNINDLESDISVLNQEIGRINQVLKVDEQRKKQYREIADSIELQQKEYTRWDKLCSLIGSGDGKKFSRFAQGLTLARLTGLANRHLLRLSDRYQILKSPEADLELQIIDGYQADVVRPMSTLSGGESFLVSLALALGLSDLASRKVQINSLFIDEGFGTLDAETLDIAISALENLQASGKTIGIISHVDALKERIGTQIQVIKQPGGSSKIQVVSYGSVIANV